MWETAFGETDAAFPQCAMHRPSNTNPEGMLSLVNHVLSVQLVPSWLDWLLGDREGVVVPDQLSADKTNSEASIMRQVELCRGTYGRNPNAILVSFFIDDGEGGLTLRSLIGLRGGMLLESKRL